MEGTVHAIITDPPYNSRSQLNQPNSSYDSLTTADMTETIEMAQSVLVPGGHCHFFCSPVQFAQWSNTIRRCTEEVPDLDEDAGGNTFKHVQTFCSEVKALHYVRSPGVYNSDPRVKRLDHMSVVDQAIHFWKMGTTNTEMLKMGNYNIPPCTKTTHPLWTNVVCNVPRLPTSEIVKVRNSVESGKFRMLRPEQKNISVMKDIVSKFSKPGDLVMDPFSGTCSTAKACLSLNKHRRFVGCELDENCLKQSIEGVLKVFAEQVLSDTSDIHGSPELENDCNLYVRYLDAKDKRERHDRWTVPGGLHPVQTFPRHILKHMSSYFMDYSLLDCCKHIPASMWKNIWRHRLETMDYKHLLSAECSAMGVLVQRSNIKHASAGLGVFADKNLGEGQLVGWYYGSLVYSDLSGLPQKYKTYSEGIMCVTVDDFEKWSMVVDHEVVARNGVRHKVFIVPAPFCAMRYINDPRYLDRDAEKLLETEKRKANVRYILDNATANGNAMDVASHTMIRVVASRNISKGDELYADYGSEYKFRNN